MFPQSLPLAASSLAVLALAALAAPASGQCFGPDNLAGPCCAPAFANLPSFPPITLPGQTICWDSCNVGAQQCNQVVLNAPTFLSCGEYTVDFQSLDCSSAPQLKGALHLDYARTWDEFTIPGAVPTQVWRFLVKADLGASSTVLGCQVPSCLGTHPTAFYEGYLDYAFDCAGGTWQAALVLFHGCDKYQHDPLFSARPGSFHPSRSFAIVAPHTPANPFVPVALPPLGGPVFFQGIRDVTPSIPGTACKTVEPLSQGNLLPLGSACACPFSFFPPQTTARHLDGVGGCGSDFRSINAFPTLPWFEMMSTSLGGWTTGASYPGPERVWIEEGTFLHTEVCSATGAPQLFAEIKIGASTEGGFLSALGPVGGDKFTDLVDNYSRALGTPILPPFFGKANPSNHLVHVNSF